MSNLGGMVPLDGGGAPWDPEEPMGATMGNDVAQGLGLRHGHSHGMTDLGCGEPHPNRCQGWVAHGILADG